ncbi:MAG TPA: tetratricopeptide repeat protein [Pyrinomonadaceae bacterium]|nr:tetratricopeptide repeat protein [Pyrinomonadaceae bacterium]
MRIRKKLVALAVVSTFTFTLAVAQKTTPKRKASSQAKPAASPTPTSGRGRRIGPATENATTQNETSKPERPANVATPGPSPANSPSPAESPSPASTTADTKPAEKNSDLPAEAASATPSDPIMTLRDQIDAAPTPQDQIRLRLQLAEELASSGKKVEAVNELHSLTGLDAFDPQGFYNAGNALARLGDTDEAVNAYRKAIEQRKGSYSRALNNLGVVLLRVGRWDEAREAFLSALRVENFHYAEASYNLGRLYATRGEMDLAVREWRRAVAVDPEHAAAAQSLARSGTEGRITVEQTRAVSRAVGKDATPAIVSGSPKSSSSNSAKPLTLDPTSFGFLQKARAASERGNKTEAIDNYQRVIARENGYFAPANLELSYLLIGLRRNDEAMTALLPVVNREGSRYPIGYYHLARIYEGKGELKLAEGAFANAVAAYGDQNGQFLLDLSRIREKQGNFKGALDAMERYVALVKKDGQDLSWSEERLTVLRQRASAPK